MYKAILAIWIGLSFQVAYAQKIERAINALKENKLEKAFDLFEDVVRKDPAVIDAYLGH